MCRVGLSRNRHLGLTVVESDPFSNNDNLSIVQYYMHIANVS
jgi:hypothetical protein